MKKSHLLSLTSIAAMMLSVTTAQNASAQNASVRNASVRNASAQNATNRNNHGHNHDPSPSSGAVDPGVRPDPPSAGGPVAGLTAAQMAFFTAASARFQVVETVPAGLGPGFN